MGAPFQYVIGSYEDWVAERMNREGTGCFPLLPASPETQKDSDDSPATTQELMQLARLPATDQKSEDLAAGVLTVTPPQQNVTAAEAESTEKKEQPNAEAQDPPPSSDSQPSGRFNVSLKRLASRISLGSDSPPAKKPKSVSWPVVDPNRTA